MITKKVALVCVLAVVGIGNTIGMEDFWSLADENLAELVRSQGKHLYAFAPFTQDTASFVVSHADREAAARNKRKGIPAPPPWRCVGGRG
ncbi:MAG: hypothetical protein LBJ92_03640 [Holosporales bacterium]|jgi:hypothetical protein|nr:hypothetical protein [Holosporales bacterium]